MTLQIVASAIMFVIALFVGFNHLLFYLYSKKEKENKYFSYVCFTIATYNLFSTFFYNSESLEEAICLQRGQFAAIAMMSFAIYYFVLKKINKKFKFYDYAILGFNTAFILLPWIPSTLLLHISNPAIRTISFLGTNLTFFEADLGIFIILMLAAVFVQIIVCICYMVKYYIKEKNREFLIFGIGLIIFGVFATADIFNALGLIHTIYLTEYGFFSIVIIMDIFLIASFIKIYNKDKIINMELEKKVEDSISEITTLNNQLSKSNKDLKEKNSELKLLTEKDSLTNLLNHSAFQTRLEELINMANCKNFSISLAMIDIDNFKLINDSYGHQRGDKILSRFANVLKENLRDFDIKARNTLGDAEQRKIQPSQTTLRSYDIAGRYGGDEFSIALPYCSKEEAEIVIKRIFEKTELISQSVLPITISCGVCYTEINSLTCSKNLIKLADTALLEAKAAGKDTYRIVKYK